MGRQFLSSIGALAVVIAVASSAPVSVAGQGPAQLGLGVIAAGQPAQRALAGEGRGELLRVLPPHSISKDCIVFATLSDSSWKAPTKSLI